VRLVRSVSRRLHNDCVVFQCARRRARLSHRARLATPSSLVPNRRYLLVETWLADPSFAVVPKGRKQSTNKFYLVGRPSQSYGPPREGYLPPSLSLIRIRTAEASFDLTEVELHPYIAGRTVLDLDLYNSGLNVLILCNPRREGFLPSLEAEYPPPDPWVVGRC
jgi:hypothetical protein